MTLLHGASKYVFIDNFLGNPAYALRQMERETGVFPIATT
jgi:hypothetical protein